MTYYFQTEQMTVGYAGKPLLTSIGIKLDKGEILTLIGPNGSGKSTILKSIAGQLSLLGGTILLGNDHVEKMSLSKRAQNMSVLLTERLRTEMMTCEDVVATGRYPYTGRFGILSETDRQAVWEAMQLVQVSELGRQDFNRISDGQKQRIMLARAICQEPELLILDEPTSFLDVKYKLEFLSVLQEMKRRKKLTVVMSLHEMELAEIISDKVMCICDHRVDRFGPPEEVLTEGYIAKLFGITSGSYEEATGNMELPKVSGDPEVFVIAGDGSGRTVYRRLQREGVPFAAGILFRNDLDYGTAKVLASRVFAAKSFEPVPDELLQDAKNTLRQCRKVICCRESFGTWEQANRELVEYAHECGISVEVFRKTHL